MNKLKEKLRLLNIESFGERIYEQEVHCVFCGKKVLLGPLSTDDEIKNHKYCDHILFLQHPEGFGYIRDDVKNSTESIEMIEHYAECSECGVRNCEKFETISKNITLNDSFVIVYQYSHPCAFGWEMIGFSPYRINELNMTQLAKKHNEDLKSKKEVR